MKLKQEELNDCKLVEQGRGITRSHRSSSSRHSGVYYI